MRRRVHITSTAAVTKKYPEFDGVLYKARDAPEKGELTLTSDELKKLNVVGEPIFVEHDEKMGKVGVIVRCSFEAPNFLITGCINTENEKLRNSIRNQLKTGELSDLSIGFSALQCTSTGNFTDKQFNEASLVKKGFYDGTNIVRVCASQKGNFKKIFWYCI